MHTTPRHASPRSPLLALLVLPALALFAAAPGCAGEDDTHDVESAYKGPRAGDPSPLVVVTVFSDYQCPGCKGAHRQLRTLPAVFGEDVEIRYRQLPLTGIHRLAADAALFALAAHRQGGFACFERGLYAEQRQWAELDRSAFAAFAAEVGASCGLDPAALAADAADPALAEAVEKDRASAAVAGAEGTPTILVNGAPVRVAQTPARNVRQRELLVPRVRAELRAARQALAAGVPRAEIPLVRALATTGDPARAAAALDVP
jgi:protein-disulfide isomerase